ncbi:MAG: hypothetical protein EXR72_12190 [Myxococcales bacterium]|nr:hypothetical protein [Myxococcales bacterium]
MRREQLIRGVTFLAAIALSGSAAAAPIRVAVMDFTDAAAGGGLEALGKGLQSMITTDLAEVSAFQLVERARLRDIEGELKLGRRGDFDRATAARIGKLAGATHLVTGSFTVVAERMRIDCRMLAVESGQIVLAAKAEGEKAAFFELEKSLVQKLISAAGVIVAPKERARLQTIHTADFDAFRKFSEGIVLFDEKRYDEAVKALREASTLDKDFKLARMTLAGYEELVLKARAGADAAKQAEEELSHLQQDSEAKREAEVVERLFAVARRKGKGAAFERQVALHLLAGAYRLGPGSSGPLARIRETGDAFALQRTADSLHRTYWAGVAEVFPQLPPIIDDENLPGSEQTFERELAATGQALRKSAREKTLDFNIHYQVNHLARRLQLDRREEAELLEKVHQLGLQLAPDAEWKQKRRKELAEDFQDVLDLDRSTAYLMQISAGTKDAKILAEVAEMLEYNRDLARLTAPGPLLAVRREFLLLNNSKPKLHPIREAKKLFVGDPLTPELARQLNHHRQWPGDEDDYLLLGDQPSWALQNHSALFTGPRSDRLRAGEIRYFQRRGGPPAAKDVIVAFGAAPQEAFAARFQISFEPAPDWRLAASSYDEKSYQELGPEGQRAEVSFLFGLRDLRTQAVSDRATRKQTPARPLRGYAVRFARDGIHVSRVTESGRADRARQLGSEPIADWRIDLAAEKRLAVSVRLDGRELQVEVNGRRFSTGAPADRSGFLGFRIAGTGWGAVGDLQITRGK